MPRIPISEIDLDAMLDTTEMEATLKARLAEEERLFGPDIDISDKAKYPDNSQVRYEAQVRLNARNSAMAAYARGASEAEVQRILNPQVMSQLVTEARARNDQRRSTSDMERAHLRRELTKALRRARSMQDDSLVHKPWLESIQDLYDYAGPAPTQLLECRFCTVDTSGPFAPGNVKWQTHDDLLMRLHIRTVEYSDGINPPETITLAEVAKRTGLSVSTIRNRYDNGVRGPDLWAGRNLGAVYQVDVEGTKLTLRQAADAWGINVNTLRARMARGLRGDALFAKSDSRTGSDKKPVRPLKKYVQRTLESNDE